MKGDKGKIQDGKYHSAYFNNAENVLDELNAVSPSFCLAKWYTSSLHIPTGQTHSCYHPMSHKIPLEELNNNPAALHNTKYKKEQRKKMLEGERPSECEFCWAIEDSSTEISDRAYRSQDVIKPGLIEEAKALGFEGDAIPRYLEVNFNQACNLKCTYCSPHLSTEWEKDIKKHGSYELYDRRHNDLSWMTDNDLVPNNSPSNPYLKAFWEWFPVIYPDLKTFRMTGGEPLMDKNTFKVFDYVRQNPNKNLQLKVTSNCCPPKGQWNKFMDGVIDLTSNDCIDHFMLFCSLDSWGEQAEYIREGLIFDQMYENICDYLERGQKHSLTFIVTFNVLSLPGFQTFLENILKLREKYSNNRQLIWFDTPMLTYPDWMSLRILPKKELEVLIDSIEFMKANPEMYPRRFKGFKDFEVSKIKRLYQWGVGDMPQLDKEIALLNFSLYFKECDRRTGKNFVDLFPTLGYLYE